MALRDEIVNYTDGEGLVAPAYMAPGSFRGSDNGVMYTSEYYVMLQKLGQLTDQDRIDYAAKIGKCIDSNGLLNRHWVALGDNGQEGPDDYYGVINGCKQLGNTDIPRKFLKCVFKYLGALNNPNPGTWTAKSFLVRQLNLVACMVSAAFPSMTNPLHYLARLAAFPFYFYTMVVLLVSCINTPTDDSDARRLAWHVWQTTKGVSLMCWLAGKVWRNRLYKAYPDAMIGVAKVYYQPGHPFTKYWITE